MARLLLPGGLAGVNRMRVRASEWSGATVRCLFVVEPVRSWVGSGPVEQLVEAIHAWATELAARVAAAPDPVVALVPRLPASRAEVRLLAEGHRLPPTGRQPSFPRDVEAVVADLRASLVDDLGAAPHTTLARSALVDFTGSLLRGLDADPELGEAEARSLRRATRGALDLVKRSGAVVTGPRAVLMWPLPPRDGRIPVEVAAEAAADLLRGRIERPAPPARRPLSELTWRELVRSVRR